MSQSTPLTERKYNDPVPLDSLKDDVKQQAFESRLGAKQAHRDRHPRGEAPNRLQEKVDQPAGEKTPKRRKLSKDKVRDAPLAPIVTPTDMKEPDVVLFHDQRQTPKEDEQTVQQPDTNVADEKGDQIASKPGQKADEGWEYVKDQVVSSIQKEEENRQWNDFSYEKDTTISRPSDASVADSSSTVVDTSLPSTSGPIGPVDVPTSTMSRAKGTLDKLVDSANHAYEEAVLPQVQKARDAFDRQFKKISTSSADSQQTGASVDDVSHGAESSQPRESLRHRVVRYRDKAIEVWHGTEPRVKARMQHATRVIAAYRMEVPLLALFTLLVLWASVSFVTWFAFPSAHHHAHRGHAGWHGANVPVSESTISQQAAQAAQTINVMHEKADAAGHARPNGHTILDDIRIRVTDRIEHAKDALRDLASGGVASLRDHMGDTGIDLNPDVATPFNPRFESDEPDAPAHWHTAQTPEGTPKRV